MADLPPGANRMDATSFVSWWLPHAKHEAFKWVRVPGQP